MDGVIHGFPILISMIKAPVISGHRRNVMVTLVVCIRRKPGTTAEFFHHHWTEVHGPLVKSVPEFIRHVRKYVQYHVAGGDAVPKGTVGHVSDYDGVAALTFDSAAAIEAAFSEPRYLEIIRPDEANFIDPDNCLTFLTEEFVM
jgi:uncharacterized protein (TIGR02118 family)